MKYLFMLVTVALLGAPAFTQAKSRKPKVTSPTKSTEQELINLENEWTNAYLHGDTAVLERIEAPRFVYTDSDGSLATKAQDIAEVKSGTYKLESFTPQNMKVHLFGDTAVVTYHGVQRGTYKGKDIGGTYAFTDIFIKRGGRWQVVGGQGARIK